MEQKNHNMTEGAIYKKIIAFAIPIFIGNLFQQLYNTVDALIVGNFLGKEALAAVSSTGSLIFLIVGLVAGVFSGAGVVISRYYGAKEYENVQNAIHTTVAAGIVASIALTLIGSIFAPQILELMGTPEDVMQNAVTYVRVYFLGVSSVILYNTANGIFQAIGDSKRPLKFLMVSSVTNVVLDLVFIVVFGMGIAGAALATVLAQTVSAVLAFGYLMRSKEVYKVMPQKIKIHSQIIREILKIGVPSGIQNSVIALGNVVVQSSINAFGAVAVAGSGAYVKVEGFVFIPITSMAMAMTVFVAQNLGAGEVARAKKGAKYGILTGVTIAEVIGILFWIFAPYLIRLFSQEVDVITYGTNHARVSSLFYCLLAFSHCMAGVLRGAGKSIVPMFVMLVFWCIGRVSYVTIGTHLIPDVRVVYWAYPITWSLSSIYFLGYYLKGGWQGEKIKSE